MKKINLNNLETFSEMTGAFDENLLLAIARFGTGRVKSSLLIYSRFVKNLHVCRDGNMKYYRYGWIELNVPIRKEMPDNPFKKQYDWIND